MARQKRYDAVICLSAVSLSCSAARPPGDPGRAGPFAHHVGRAAHPAAVDPAKDVERPQDLQSRRRRSPTRLLELLRSRTPARRPKYSALSNEKMERAGIAPMPPLADCVKAYLAEREKPVSSAKGSVQNVR